MKLLKQYVKMIEDDPELQGKIAKAADKSVQAVAIWAKRPNHEKLVMKHVLRAIMEYTGVKSEDELVEQPAAV